MSNTKLEKLTTVSFREAVTCPGSAPGAVGPTESRIHSVTTNSGVMGRQQYNLYFQDGLVIVEHPKSLQREYVPWSNVKQFTRASEAPQAKP